MASEMQIRRTENQRGWRGAFAALLLQWIPDDREKSCDEYDIYDRMLAARTTYGLPESRLEALAEIVRALKFLWTRHQIAYRFGHEKGVYLTEDGVFDRTRMFPRETKLVD
jgi:hypothetical protein